MRKLTDAQLLTLDKPGRYTGGELNVVTKDIHSEMIRFAFCFPDVYEVGMSHYGLQLLYFFINQRDDTYCERAFMPWFDMIDLLKETQVPLFTTESGDDLSEFDILGFTLQYEMSYTNVLAMLELSGIPLRSSARDDAHPIICAGGPCATNPEPMADFIDFFYIGDGEASIHGVLDAYKEHKRIGSSKDDFLLSIAVMDGIYVPKFYKTEYNSDNTLSVFEPIVHGVPVQITRAFIPELTFFPEKMVMPIMETIHDRSVVEISRGCKRGCRFCQAGYIYGPVRERPLDALLDHAEKLLDSSGSEEISLLSLSACDYSAFNDLLDELVVLTERRNVNISLPSSRLDAIFLDALKKTQKVRKSSLTVAPEAGSQKMRDVILKNLTEENILDGCYNAFSSGFDKIKLYFITGLPFENKTDQLAISDLCDKIVSKYYELSAEQRKRPPSVSVSCAMFVPKAHTPFQWAAQVDIEAFVQDQRDIKDVINKKRVSYRYHDAKTGFIEAILARGDRRLSDVIEKVYLSGAIFDGWSEHFAYDKWLTAFECCGIDPKFYANRERCENELLPWDFINMGVSKSALLNQWQKAKGIAAAYDAGEGGNA